MKIRIVSTLEPQVRGWYDEATAVLTLQVCDRKAKLDESDLDNVLRLIDASAGPDEDLTELFQEEFGPYAYRVARHVISNHATLEALVYA